MRTLAAVLLLLCPLLAMAAQTLQIVTEEYPPFNYTENGKLTGVSTEIVQALLKETGFQGDFHSLPWARAYELALQGENTLIYTITRTPQRESLFKWVGVVASPRHYLFAWARRPLKLERLDDARRYQIATVNEDVGEQFLMAHGFIKGRDLQSNSRYVFGYEKLKLGRVQLWVMDELVASYVTRQAGDDPDKVLVKALWLEELSGGHYLAFGPRTPDALVERFRRALDTLRRNGTLAAILQKWRIDAPPR